jgi:putative flippase GtrA
VERVSAALPQFLRFLAVGGLNTAFGYALFAVFTWAGMPYPAAIGAATVLGVLFNYQTTARLVFSGPGRGRLWRFVAVYAVVYVLNVAAVAALLRAGYGVYLANALAIPPLVAVTFLLQRSFVFREP